MIMINVEGPDGERINITTGLNGEECGTLEEEEPDAHEETVEEKIAKTIARSGLTPQEFADRMNASSATELAPALSHRDEFFAAVAVRLNQGAQDYKDESFNKPLRQLLDELEQEALDLAGWGFIAWEKIQRMRALARTVE